MITGKETPDNRHKSLQDLRKKILYCIKQYDCRCASRHTCQLRNCWSTPHALLEMQKHLHLEVEGCPITRGYGFLRIKVINRSVLCSMFLLNHCLEEIHI